MSIVTNDGRSLIKNPMCEMISLFVQSHRSLMFVNLFTPITDFDCETTGRPLDVLKLWSCAIKQYKLQKKIIRYRFIFFNFGNITSNHSQMSNISLNS